MKGKRFLGYLGPCVDVGALGQQCLDHIHVARDGGSVQT